MLSGMMPWEGTERTRVKNTEVLEIEGGEPKGTNGDEKSIHAAEVRLARECFSRKRKRDRSCLDGVQRSHAVWSVVSSYSVAIVIFCLD